MRFIFSTGSIYTYGLGRCFDLAARAGFDGIEVMLDQRWDTRQPHVLKALIDRYQIPILALHSPFGVVPGWPTEPEKRLKKSASLARKVGAEIVVHHLPERFGSARLHVAGKRLQLPWKLQSAERRYRRWLEDQYATVQERAPDVRLCIENMPARNWLGARRNAHVWNSVEAMTRFTDITMDTTHLGTWGLEPVDVYERWGERIKHIHFSNFDGREHRRPERGHLRLDALLQRLAQDAYSGAISFELHPRAAHAGSSDEHIADLLAASLHQSRGWAGAASAAIDSPSMAGAL